MLSYQHLQEYMLSVVDSISADCKSVYLKVVVHIVGHFESLLLLERLQL